MFHSKLLTAMQLVVVVVVGPVQAENVVLERGAVRYEINGADGSLVGASADGKPFMEASHDEYRLLPPRSDQTLASTEAADRVTDQRNNDDGSVTLVCANDEVGLTVTKTYWIEEGSGYLFKRTATAAHKDVVGLLLLESGAAVPGQWWRGAVIWQPVWHTWARPFVLTDDIKEETNLAPTNGCRAVVALYQPKQKATVVHWRWGGEEFEMLHVVGERKNFGKRVWPRRWLTGSREQFVGGPEARIATDVFVYGVHPGTAGDFYRAYGDRRDYHNALVEPMQGAPAWVDDIYFDEHFDRSYLQHGYFKLLRDVMAKKLHFGHMTVVQWGAFPFEYYCAKPEQVEEGSREDPVATAELMGQVKAISPRIKAGLYSHFGSPSTKKHSDLHALAEEQGWLAYQRDGGLMTHATDYSAGKKLGVSMTKGAVEYRQYLKTRYREIFDHLNIDVMNVDAAPRAGGYEYDWSQMRVGTAAEVMNLYNDFLAIAFEHNGTAHLNFPVPGGSTAGFSEWPWFPTYSNDWRLFSGRLAIQQAMNASGRRINLAGFIMPSGMPNDPTMRLHLNYMQMMGLGLSMLDLKPVERKRDLYTFGGPWIQAGYELRRRAWVSANVEPNWLHDIETEIEVYAWRMMDDYGLVTVMNHGADTVLETIVFDSAPLGLRPELPIYVWRMEVADPRNVEYEGITMDTPIRNLARQQLLAANVPNIPRHVIPLALPPENPVAIMVTHCPAVITSVNGKPCQYWLPAAYGVSVATDTGQALEANKVQLLVKNTKDRAELLIVVPTGIANKPHVQQRHWGDQGLAGVVTGFRDMPHEVVQMGGDGLIWSIKTTVGPGDTQIVID